MNQRISVRAIIQKDDKVLLLKRATGRPTILGKFELPGGRVGYGEQPEDTLRRYLYDDIHLHVHSSRLYDAVTYIDHDDRDIQYGVIVYTVHIRSDGHSLRLGREYSKYVWQKMRNIHQSELTDLSQLLLGIIQQDKITESSIEDTHLTDVNKTSNDMVTIYSDGGSRGNPGPSAAGYVILDYNQVVLDQGGEYLGITTNNQAEYQGVRLALEKAELLGYKRISFCLDSMLVVNQMNGLYKIKNRELWPIHERIRELITHFDKVTFRHVPRERNQLADSMVNKTLDSHQGEE